MYNECIVITEGKENVTDFYGCEGYYPHSDCAHYGYTRCINNVSARYALG